MFKRCSAEAILAAALHTGTIMTSGTPKTIKRTRKNTIRTPRLRLTPWNADKVIDEVGSELQTMGQGLRELGATLEGLLPGLPGQAAGRTARFLAEHAWLLILAAVVVFFKRAA